MSTPTRWQEFPQAPSPGAFLCALDELADGQARMLTLGEGEKPFRLLILRSGEQLYGYVNACAHFGVPLAARQEQLLYKPHETLTCNVHYARFRWQDGYCYHGDCEGDSLVPVPLTVKDGAILIA